jgi:hypothetical protein
MLDKTCTGGHFMGTRWMRARTDHNEDMGGDRRRIRSGNGGRAEDDAQESCEDLWEGSGKFCAGDIHGGGIMGGAARVSFSYSSSFSFSPSLRAGENENEENRRGVY